jgi:hypothetical protein
MTGYQATQPDYGAGIGQGSMKPMLPGINFAKMPSVSRIQYGFKSLESLNLVIMVR